MSRFGGRRTRNFRQAHLAGGCRPNTFGYCPCPLELADEDVAELVCSDVAELAVPFGGPLKMHRPVIDLDFSASLVPSATPGHFHLYLERDVPFEAYVNVLKAMAEAGLVEWGFLNATEERGFGSVRHPDRPKPAATPDAW